MRKWPSPKTLLFILFLPLLLNTACAGDPGLHEPEPGINNQPDPIWTGPKSAPRGLSALGGDGYNLIRYSPAPWADKHQILASRDEGLSNPHEIPIRSSGLAIHEDLTHGETWYYQVLASSNNDEESSEIVSAKPLKSALLSIYLEMDQGDLNELYNRPSEEEERLPAKVFIGGSDKNELETEGIRFRGATTRGYEKKQFNIRLQDRPELDDLPDFNFRSDERRAGNRLTLNAMWTDPTALREVLSFMMYDELRLIAPTTYYTELYINQIYEGLYIGIERVDREALRRWGLNRKEGQFTMVRDESKSNRHRPEISRRSIFGANIDAVTDSDEEAIALLQEVFRFRGDAEDQNWSGLLELIRWAYSTPSGSTYAREFKERFELEPFIDFLVIHVLTHDRDSLDVDYWLYRDDANDGKWQLIPWDKNLTFGAHYYEGFQGDHNFFEYDRDFLPTMGNALVDKFFKTPELNALFQERLIFLAAEVFTDAWFEEKIQELSPQIAPAMARIADEHSFEQHPGQHQGLTGWWNHHIEALLDAVSLRRSWVFDHLNLSKDELTPTLRFHSEEEGGAIIADFQPQDPTWNGELSVKLSEETRADTTGPARRWILKTSAPTKGRWTLYWKNSPHITWLPTAEAPPARQWYLNAHINTGDEWELIEARVNPFSNKLEFDLEFDDEVLIELDY